MCSYNKNVLKSYNNTELLLKSCGFIYTQFEDTYLEYVFTFYMDLYYVYVHML